MPPFEREPYYILSELFAFAVNPNQAKLVMSDDQKQRSWRYSTPIIMSSIGLFNVFGSKLILVKWS